MQAFKPTFPQEYLDALTVALGKCVRFKPCPDGATLQTWWNVAPDVDQGKLILALDGWAVSKPITRSMYGWRRTMLTALRKEQDKVRPAPGGEPQGVLGRTLRNVVASRGLKQ